MATIREAMDIARQHVEAGRWDLAEQVCRQVLQAEPECHEAWHLLGVAAFRAGRAVAAEDWIGQAIALAPGEAEYYSNLGTVRCAQGLVHEGIACYVQALELRPDLGGVQQNLERARARRRIYPMRLPPIAVQHDLDLLLLNMPPMNMGELVPNGLGHVHNALVRSGVRFQTVDVNVHLYHAFYQKRILGKAPLTAPGGRVLDDYLWGPTKHLQWERDDVFEFFRPQIDHLLAEIVRGRPKAVGLSVHASNRVFSRRFIGQLRRAAPEVLVLLGGYDCVDPQCGPALYADFDYMAIFEADLTIGPLVAAIARGERPKDLPGIVSRWDTPGRAWEPAPLVADLDSIDYPRYQWADPQVYELPGAGLPLMASRGCSWGRCRFCAECFPFRFRSPRKLADEIEEWMCRGGRLFHFYDSDVNGNPDALDELCSEIIRRRLRPQLSAQIRVDRRSTAEYFRHMRQAGFLHLRFGVDGWTDHTLKLQRKGYTMATVAENLRDCHAAGIQVGVNIVVGVPGETEADIAESIENLTRAKADIDSVEFINPISLRTVSDYFRNSDEHNIRFRVDKAEILRRREYYVPDGLWYSEDPYIDWRVRVQRCQALRAALRAQEVNVGPHAQWVIDGLQRPGAWMDGFGEIREEPPPS